MDRCLNGPRTTDHGRAAAFTLIELLVVIAIIGVLVALISAGVMMTRSKGLETANRVEIAELDQALTLKFKEKFGVYPPSQIMLCETLGSYGGAQIHTESKNFLYQMFGSRIQGTWTAPGIDWNGDGTRGNFTGTLYGDQCLVFFLGGIPNPSAGGCKGFSTNPSDPSDFTQPQQPWRGYEFNAGRLANLRGNGFWSYLDAYKQQRYAYFSSYNLTNGYSRYGGASDCPGLRVPDLFPYAQSAGIYVNPNSFQIISAGRDGAFEAGGIWGSTGKDDQANFARGNLGAGP